MSLFFVAPRLLVGASTEPQQVNREVGQLAILAVDLLTPYIMLYIIDGREA